MTGGFELDHGYYATLMPQKEATEIAILEINFHLDNSFSALLCFILNFVVVCCLFCYFVFFYSMILLLTLYQIKLE